MQLLLRVTLFCAVFSLWLTTKGFAQDDVRSARDQDAAAIEAAIQSYVTAFNARDAEQLAKQWASDGVYISRTSGDRVEGRDAIMADFQAMFAEGSQPRIEVSTESIEFISPNVALERGVATVVDANDTVSQTSYRVVYVQQDGAWLIDRVTEEEVEVTPSNYEKLKGLEWMIGSWVDESEEGSLSIDCDWTTNQNYISRKYNLTRDEGVESSGLQIIGWDAKTEQIRSWLFDSSGGFVNGTWSQRENQWVVQSVATLPDGGSGSSTSIFRPIDDGSYAWRKINRVIDGELLPNVDEVLVIRKDPQVE